MRRVGETVEEMILELLNRFSDAHSLEEALTELLDEYLNLIDIFSYSEIMYIFKQVLLRYYCQSSFNYMEAARRLGINRTTLAEIRRNDPGRLNQYPPIGGNL